MSGKGSGKMFIINSAVSAQVDIDIVATILIPLIENRFGNDEYRGLKLFFRKGISMKCPASSLNLNLIGNWKLKKKGSMTMFLPAQLILEKVGTGLM